MWRTSLTDNVRLFLFLLFFEALRAVLDIVHRFDLSSTLRCDLCERFGDHRSKAMPTRKPPGPTLVMLNKIGLTMGLWVEKDTETQRFYPLLKAPLPAS